VDAGAVEGIAVMAVDNSHGTWQYTTDNGSTWTAFGTPSESSARLLAADANTKVRFVPNADWNGTVNPGITFRAWDQTSGSNGGTADSSTNGGTTAFSTATATAEIVVNALNDAPVLDNTGTMTLVAVDQDDVTNSGTLVSGIIASAGGDRITDVDAGPVEGIAVVAVDDSHGTWQYTTDNGSTWTALGAPSESSARLLAADSTTAVRFVPDVQWSGTVDPGITFRAWDQTSGSNGGTADVTVHGGTTAFSTATETAAIVVNASAAGSISGVKFHDQNGNGIQDGAEPGLQGWTIFLDTNGNGILDEGERFEVTGSDGRYTFTGVAAGTYQVAEVIRSGWVPTFATQTTALNTSNDPTDLALADIDGDGDLDALVVIPGSSAVVRVQNDGDGGFTRLAGSVTVGGNPVAIAVGDFDGVNGLDFATANSAGNTISVRRNDGSGNYPTELASGLSVDIGDGHEQPVVVAAGRFASDQDGDLDLFTALALDNSWIVFANDGNAVFTSVISSWPVWVDLPRDTAVGDFNGDGLDDVALVYLTSDNVLIELNGATGLSSGGSRRISVGDVPTGIAVADFDGDSHLDFVTSNRDSGDVTVVLNQGGANFAAGVAYPAGATPLHVATGDFNGDGFPDIVVANRTTNSISLLMNRGNGTFAAPLAFSTGNSPETVGVADLDGDGVDDILVVNKTARTLSVLRNTAGAQTVTLGV
jgi:hypothetical protein